MKYTLINKKVSTEVDIDEETYQVDIHLSISSDNELIPSFTKVITVISNNAQTGYEVDEQRTNEINSYISEINK